MDDLERYSLQEKTKKRNINNKYNNDLLESLNDLDTQKFVENTINSRNNIIDTNPILSEDEKSKIKENFQSFKKQVENNKLLFDKYQWNEKLFFRKILDKRAEKNLLNQTENINDVEMKFIWWNFVIEISDTDMDKYFSESANWCTIDQPGLEIDWIPIIPIIVRKNFKEKYEIIYHELQHFYNRFLIKYSDEMGKLSLSLLADETIAQTISWSWWQNAEDWKRYLAQCITYWVQDWNPHNDYTFWNRFNVSADYKIRLNQQILQNLENVDVARELRDAWIENYADILAITPLDKRSKLRNIYLNK